VTRLIIIGINYTGAGINPARAFATDVISGSFPGYHWIYWVGPLLGSLLSAGFFKLLGALHWQETNPGQDYDDLETQAITPEKKTLRPNVAQLVLPPVAGLQQMGGGSKMTGHGTPPSTVGEHHDGHVGEQHERRVV
jgi:hypothetical protein